MTYQLEVFGCAQNCPFGIAYGRGGMCAHPSFDAPEDIPEFERQFTPEWCPLTTGPVEVKLVARVTAPIVRPHRPFSDE